MKKPRRFTQLTACCLVVCATLALVPRGWATDWDVSMTEDAFDPAYLEVYLGDTVWWWNDDFFDFHSTRSYSYPWNSGGVPPGYGVHLTVTRLGTFDSVDTYFGYWGTLVVKPALPPAPTLSEPAKAPSGGFSCQVGNLVAGKTYVIQASTDLLTWNGIYTNVASSSSEPY